MTNVCLHWSIGLYLALSVAPVSVADDTRHVTVFVHASADDGNQLAGVPLQLCIVEGIAPLPALCFAMTDQQGNAKLEADMPKAADTLFCGVYLSPDDSRFYTADQRQKNDERVRDLQRQYYLEFYNLQKQRLKLHIEPDKSEYHLELTATTAIKVKGVLTDSQAKKPVTQGTIVARQINTMHRLDRNGRFDVGSLPRGQANELFFIEWPIVVSVLIRADQANENVDVGLIEVPELDRSTTLDITVNSGFELGKLNVQERNEPTMFEGVTLISTDGRMMLTWLAEAGRVSSAIGATVNPTMPPGEYLVAPGRFHASATQLGLLDAIRAGVDLKDSGIPRVIAKEGQTISLEINALDADAAIRKIIPKAPSSTQPAATQPQSK